MNIGESVFYEKINIKKLNYILNNRTKYEPIIEEQEKDMRRTDKNYNAFAVFQKIKQNIIIPNELKDTDFGYLKITYNKGKNSNGIGRWYCNKGIGIQPLCVSVRHTICDGLWTDIDQVNSHPTILKNFIDKYSLKSPLLDECMNNRELFLEKISKEEKCNRDTAKTLVIATINGKKYKSKTLINLANELKPIINYISNLDEFKDIKDYVEETYKDDKNISGKIISRILQVIENNLLETYIEFFNDKGLISKFNDGYEVALIFDGLQLRTNDKINDELLDECRLYAFNKTGYNIQLKIKPFDNPLELPYNFKDEEDDDLNALINKYEIGLNNINTDTISHTETLLHSSIYNAISSNGTHASVSNVFKELFKKIIVYDEYEQSWFHCNINNIWVKTKSPYISQGLLKSIVSKLFLNYATYFNQKVALSNDEGEKELGNKRSASSMKIAFQLNNIGYVESIIKFCKVDLNKSKFYETKIDSYGSLFAFKNKVLDCRSLEIRNIRPDDYIMNNTGYDYPEYIDEEYVKKINEYFETIYYNKDVCEYMWDNYALLLNGEREFQTFNIHNGKGSNSKSTLFTMLKMILGDYFCKINADTFTKQSRSANSTSELYKTKGTRLVFFNEPTDDDENKLQVSLLKELADGFKSTLKTRALFKESIEFPIFFRVEGCCNNKPTLSSADGGISRRVRVIDYPVIFKQNADPNNPLEVELDLQMGSILTTNEMRDTFIKLLIDRFINISSKLKKENIPKQIQEASLDYVSDSNPILAFITEKYIITKNNKDRISSTDLFTEFKISNCSKLSDKKFKDYLTNISGIEYLRSNGSFYTGLIQKPEF
jgi:P4 family phage/plasmid primase-like protien